MSGPDRDILWWISSNDPRTHNWFVHRYSYYISLSLSFTSLPSFSLSLFNPLFLFFFSFNPFVFFSLPFPSHSETRLLFKHPHSLLCDSYENDCKKSSGNELDERMRKHCNSFISICKMVQSIRQSHQFKKATNCVTFSASIWLEYFLNNEHHLKYNWCFIIKEDLKTAVIGLQPELKPKRPYTAFY